MEVDTDTLVLRLLRNRSYSGDTLRVSENTEFKFIKWMNVQCKVLMGYSNTSTDTTKPRYSLHAGCILCSDTAVASVTQNGETQQFTCVAIHNLPEFVELVISNNEPSTWVPILSKAGENPTQNVVCNFVFNFLPERFIKTISDDLQRVFRLKGVTNQTLYYTNCCFFVRRLLWYNDQETQIPNFDFALTKLKSGVISAWLIWTHHLISGGFTQFTKVGSAESASNEDPTEGEDECIIDEEAMTKLYLC